MSCLDSNLDKLFNDVNGLLITKGKRLECSDDVFEHIVESIVLDLIKENKVNDKEYDSVILIKFDDYFKKVNVSVQEYIRNLLYSKVDLLNNISVIGTIEKITKDVLFTGDVSYFDLMNGRLDDYIINHASLKKTMSGMRDCRNYIVEKIKEVSNFDLTEDEILKFGSKITFKLHDDFGYSYKDILDGRYDSMIFRFFYRSVMVDSSVQKENVPQKIKHETKKKKMFKKIRDLLVLAVLVSSLVGGGLFVGKVAGELRFGAAYSGVKEVVDDFSYKIIYSPDNDMVLPTAVNALDYYNKIDDLGLDNNVYNFLGFYSAYRNVGQDKLYVMEEIFAKAKNNSAENPEYFRVYEVIREDGCFLGFVMNRLYDMGCEKIMDAKYTDVLQVYKVAKKNLDGGNVMDSDELTEKQKNIVEEIMSLYRKYCKDAIIKLDNIFEEQGLTDMNSNNAGRTI